MNWTGWPLTVIIIAISLAISAILFQMGIFFFFLPIIFLPFLRFLRKPKVVYEKSCPRCGMHSAGNYCPRCGAKL